MARPSGPELLEPLETGTFERMTEAPLESSGSFRSGPRIGVRWSIVLAFAASVIGLTSAVAVIRPSSGRSATASTVCSTIGGGPSACVTVRGRSVVAMLRNDLNVEVCGDFRLTLLRYEAYNQRLDDPNELRRSGCLPANEEWDVQLPLRRPGLMTTSGRWRPYRFMCVTGYRLRYRRWTETGWACRPSK